MNTDNAIRENCPCCGYDKSRTIDGMEKCYSCGCQWYPSTVKKATSLAAPDAVVKALQDLCDAAELEDDDERGLTTWDAYKNAKQALASLPIATDEQMINRKIGFTDERTGIRHEFAGLSELIMAYLKALPIVQGEHQGEITIRDGFVGFYCNAVNIYFAGYDTKSQVLRIEMNNGNKYDYPEVPKHIWEGLAASESRSKYYAESIKGHYRYHHVNGD